MASRMIRNFLSISCLSPILRHKTSDASKATITIHELYRLLETVMGVESGYSPIPPDRTHLLKYLPEKQSELPPRTMQDSYLAALIPLSSNKRLQDKYATFVGSVRVGRLLEDMDIFAVMLVEKHILNPKLPKGVPAPQTLVTALVDRIDFSDFVPKLVEDIRISGHVCWVGHSSLETVVWLEQSVHGTWERITQALFVIAARDPTHTRAAMVNPLVLQNDIEKQIFKGGEKRKLKRGALDKQHVSKVLPDTNEQQIIHNLYLKTIANQNFGLKNNVPPPGSVWMEDCTLSNTIFSQPDNRNLHNKIFGGFIMRQATELSWVLGFTFSKYRPKLKRISDIKFNKPIAVSSLVHMHAFVVFTQTQYIQITVFVETFEPQTGSSETTNIVHFTYEVPELVKTVYPRSYKEAMMYIDGRRHFLEIMNRPDAEDSLLKEEGIINKH